MTRVGVVMITFRGREAVSRSLDALTLAREHLGEDADVAAVIVDNASNDGTVEGVRHHAPWAELVESPHNKGFAAACNAGIERLSGVDVVVLLNPDVEVGVDFLSRVAAFDWPADVAARGAAIIDARGQLEQSARGFPRARTALFGRSSLVARIWPESRFLRHDLQADSTSGERVVDWVSGACMIVPAERFASVGPLDEGYFMYWEDADWCFRARARGSSVIYDPSLVVTHHQGSSSRDRWVAATVAFHRSAYRYWRSHVATSDVSRLAAALALTLRCALMLLGRGAARVIPQLKRRSGP